MTSPAVVMAYTGSGADRLRSVLAAFPRLTCTAGTGILPLCHHAATTWQLVDGMADGELSPLAVTSVRQLTSVLITAILARGGGSRWCEFAAAPPAAAENFARIYPQTQFLVVHRRADVVIRAITGASRWGLAGPEFAPFVAASPSSTIAALASYWATHTTEQLEFEQAHPRSCLRVRIEDLRADAARAVQDVSKFLALETPDVLSWLPGDETGDPADVAASTAASRIPREQIPPGLLAQLDELHRVLGYPPFTEVA
jgi:hypothetical protein